jgi:hypothetical protein
MHIGSAKVTADDFIRHLPARLNHAHGACSTVTVRAASLHVFPIDDKGRLEENYFSVEVADILALARKSRRWRGLRDEKLK